jgi:hypothetical protein
MFSRVLAALLVIVNNLNLRWTGRVIRPLETNSPRIVDPKAVLSLSVAAQRLKAIAGQYRQIFQRCGGFVTVQF